MEEEYTSLDLAAALLKMNMGEDSEDIIECSEPCPFPGRSGPLRPGL